ncbi:tyrosine-type recombinase/integrase [Chromohalobacter sarecensis]|uniref:Tyrosine-type recombinase/integrase n=1 Tax=Chromohalobacter sarecensis TaxID=245294 RepID=A0ABV9CXU2_9GAMM|nr:tyrosine-type recombinase/integrase [Chromohalobacter sarecensis]MCK0713363.1 tyrosine-type recombinase/integrase [Chromohalobacter sarecensis]
MAIRKTKDGWKVDLRPNGRDGKRVRRTFKTQADARRFENRILASVADGNHYAPAKKDQRRLSELVELWYRHHGTSLKASRERVRSLRKTVEALGDPIARSFSAQDWAEYRTERLEEVAPITVNHEHTYLKAVFSELERLGLWEHGNPLARMRLLRVEETEMAFLDDDQIAQLLHYLKGLPNRDCYFITLLCLTTGARWSEAETLRGEKVGPDRVTYAGTKSGKSRTIPIPTQLASQLRKRRRIGRLFVTSYKTFRKAIQETGIELPSGQLTHVLRHTFASHFMMNGGNILVLQRILGHQSLTMTMRYAHFAPEHLEDAVRLNPLAGVDKMWTPTKKPP